MIPFKGILYDTFSYLHVQMPTGDGRKAACADFELNLIECLEAYGITKGSNQCHKYFEDYHECKQDGLKNMRSYLMTLERYKKIAKGEIAFKERHVEPIPYDSFVAGTFWP